VAPKRTAPTVRLRRLAAELRRLRNDAGVTREETSEQTGINPATLYRIERAKARPQMRTLVAMLNLYQVDDETRGYLTELCHDATKQGWLLPFHADLPEEYTAYISFEDEAQCVRNYESLYIPGLLQTEDYARAVICGGWPTATETEVENRVRTRMERRAVLTKESPLRFWAVLDEAALRRTVGGPDIMRAQLDHLLDAAKTPNVTLQMIRFGAGAHPGMPGQFVVMEFSDPLDTDLIYIDSLAGEMFLESDDEISRFRSNFDTLVAVAASPNDSAEFIAEMARELKEAQ